MSDMRELVDLPDPDVQPLVHPLDLPGARRPFRVSWLISTLTSPPVGLCAAAIVWFASHNYVVPLIAGAAIIGFGQLASRVFREQAWAFVPRKRQDRGRRLPASWELGSGLVFATMLAVALLLVMFRLDRPDVAIDVREVTLGLAAGAALLVVIDLAGTLTRAGDGRGRALFMVPAVVAVVAIVAIAYRVLLGWPDAAPPARVWWGVAAMLVVGAGVGIWRYAHHRRA